VVFSHAGDDPLACRDYIRGRLGLEPFAAGRPGGRNVFRSPAARERNQDAERRKAMAQRIWLEAGDPNGSPVETYLQSRGLDLADIGNDVLRFHPACPWAGEDGHLMRLPAMVAAMCSIETGELTAVHRTVLTADGAKIGRRMLGAAGGSAIKFDAYKVGLDTLTIGEGIETTASARRLGFGPAWALGAVGGIAAFPVLSGVQVLQILAERQPDGTPNRASEKAIGTCGERWHEAGQQVVVVDPPAGDMNDVLLAAGRI
jgi:hypothetical protein